VLGERWGGRRESDLFPGSGECKELKRGGGLGWRRNHPKENTGDSFSERGGDSHHDGPRDGCPKGLHGRLVRESSRVGGLRILFEKRVESHSRDGVPIGRRIPERVKCTRSPIIKRTPAKSKKNVMQKPQVPEANKAAQNEKISQLR